MSNSVKTLIFATALCFVCSILLTAAATGLKSFQQKNIAVDKQKNILINQHLVKNLKVRKLFECKPFRGI